MTQAFSPRTAASKRADVAVIRAGYARISIEVELHGVGVRWAGSVAVEDCPVRDDGQHQQQFR